ncbi:hypothetical protein B0H14DRAFT_2694356 [Mycena olivaceomarginata]|nr:hypothetical protein B0H14DRAFT_2694356 [Mycena olivaceomarginata]
MARSMLDALLRVLPYFLAWGGIAFGTRLSPTRLISLVPKDDQRKPGSGILAMTFLFAYLKVSAKG